MRLRKLSVARLQEFRRTLLLLLRLGQGVLKVCIGGPSRLARRRERRPAFKTELGVRGIVLMAADTLHTAASNRSSQTGLPRVRSAPSLAFAPFYSGVGSCLQHPVRHGRSDPAPDRSASPAKGRKVLDAEPAAVENQASLRRHPPVW